MKWFLLGLYADQYSPFSGPSQVYGPYDTQSEADDASRTLDAGHTTWLLIQGRLLGVQVPYQQQEKTPEQQAAEEVERLAPSDMAQMGRSDVDYPEMGRAAQ